MVRKGLFSLFILFTSLAAVVPAAAESREEREIFQLVNAERAKKRLGAMEWSDRLANMARAYSKQMSKERFFSHYDEEGKSVTDRAYSRKIFDWKKIGENLFYSRGIDDFTAFAVKGWMRSPTHRENILDPVWTETGIGAYQGDDGKIYVTQIFVKRF